MGICHRSWALIVCIAIAATLEASEPAKAGACNYEAQTDVDLAVRALNESNTWSDDGRDDLAAVSLTLAKHYFELAADELGSCRVHQVLDRFNLLGIALSSISSDFDSDLVSLRTLHESYDANMADTDTDLYDAARAKVVGRLLGVKGFDIPSPESSDAAFDERMSAAKRAYFVAQRKATGFKPSRERCENPDVPSAIAGAAVEPDFPNAARIDGASGTSEITVALDRAGNVIGVGIYKSSGYAELDEAALAAARKTRYTPQIVACVKAAGRYLFISDFQEE